MKQQHKDKLNDLRADYDTKLSNARASLQKFEQGCEFENVLETYNN